MSHTHIPSNLRHQVLAQFPPYCCYCLTQPEVTGVLLTIDHIIPEVLGGPTVLENLCPACWECNLAKRTTIVAPDPLTGAEVSLFQPATQNWYDHFGWDESKSEVIGQTPIGRATVLALRLNRPHLVQARKRWTAAGWHPPQS